MPSSYAAATFNQSEPIVMRTAGVVIIGRNEGERLRACLASVRDEAVAMVYVDSGSTDGSPDMARSMGVEVVELSRSGKFTAARARNAGFNRLMTLQPGLEFLQFVDGDCEVVAGWLGLAEKTLRDRPDVAVVCGRRRERYPDATIYNRLCDMEWNTPVGEAEACGGDAMMRAEAFTRVGGYDETIIAGEEPELCIRLRQCGMKVLRLDAEMTIHDARMTRFSQWWKRTVRAGHAYAEGAWMHGRSPGRHRVRQCMSIWFWAVGLPVAVAVAAWITSGVGLLLLLSYPLLATKIYVRRRIGGDAPRHAAAYAVFCVVGKFAEWMGQCRYLVSRLRRRPSTLIEYRLPHGRDLKETAS